MRSSGVAATLGIGTFLITRLGNVPINRMIHQWIATGPGPRSPMFVLALAAAAFAVRYLSGHRQPA